MPVSVFDFYRRPVLRAEAIDLLEGACLIRLSQGPRHLDIGVDGDSRAIVRLLEGLRQAGSPQWEEVARTEELRQLAAFLDHQGWLREGDDERAHVTAISGRQSERRYVGLPNFARRRPLGIRRGWDGWSGYWASRHRGSPAHRAQILVLVPKLLRRRPSLGRFVLGAARRLPRSWLLGGWFGPSTVAKSAFLAARRQSRIV
jgi:hypothetical protein